MAWEGFDIETSGLLPEYALQPWRCKDNQAWMTTYALATQSPDVEGGHMPTREFIRSLAQRWVTERTVVCAWNAKFEASWLFAYGCGDLVHKIRWLDGMLLWKHLEVEPEYDTVAEKKRYFGLKLAVAEFMPEYAGYEEDVDFHDESPEARAKLLAYNKIDAMTTLKITRMLYERLQESPRQLQAALIETAAISLVAEAAYEGMELDRVWLNHLGAELDQQAHDALTVLAPHGVTEKVVRSPKQLSKLLFETWGLEPIKQNTSKKTGNVTDSTDKEVLHELALVDERAKHLHLYREALGNKTKFVDNILTAIDYNNDGRAHPLANIFGTYSGRMTYTSTQGKGKDKRQIGWALHQQKRGEMYRNVMIAPEGYTLCEFDAAGQEFRWMAILSGDSTMQALCAEGEDAHGYMGAEIAHVEYRALVQAVKDGSKNAKNSRQLGKLANLCVAKGTKIITDRGICNIEDVRYSDLVWDGVAFVAHEGVVCSGYKPVITYGGVTATPDHRVLVGTEWEEIQDAARHGWKIEPALGAGQQSSRWAAIRIVDGVIRRGVSEVWRAVRSCAVRLWCGARYQPPFYGAGAISAVQGEPAARHIREGGHRQDRQRWSLRSWKLALGYERGELGEPRAAWVYDIVNCGPRSRFAANGVIVHNSLQYRTSANKLRTVARAQYGLPMELPEAQMIHATYLRNYPGVPAYWSKQIAMCTAQRFVQTLAGRRVKLPRVHRLNEWSVQSTTLNYPVQGVGADQKYLALATLKPYMVQHGIKFALELHDGIYLYIPDELVGKCVPEIKHLLGTLPYAKAWGFTPPIPLPFDAKTGKSWGNLKDWEGK